MGSEAVSAVAEAQLDDAAKEVDVVLDNQEEEEIEPLGDDIIDEEAFQQRDAEEDEGAESEGEDTGVLKEPLASEWAAKSIKAEKEAAELEEEEQNEHVGQSQEEEDNQQKENSIINEDAVVEQ